MLNTKAVSVSTALCAWLSHHYFQISFLIHLSLLPLPTCKPRMYKMMSGFWLPLCHCGLLVATVMLKGSRFPLLSRWRGQLGLALVGAPLFILHILATLLNLHSLSPAEVNPCWNMKSTLPSHFSQAPDNQSSSHSKQIHSFSARNELLWPEY